MACSRMYTERADLSARNFEIVHDRLEPGLWDNVAAITL